MIGLYCIRVVLAFQDDQTVVGEVCMLFFTEHDHDCSVPLDHVVMSVKSLANLKQTLHREGAQLKPEGLRLMD